MHVKFQRRSLSAGANAARRANLVLLAVLAACGDPDASDGDFVQTGNPVQNGDAGLADTGIAINPAMPDAGNSATFDAGAGKDAGAITMGFDAAVPDAGSADASGNHSDAGSISDAGSDAGDAGGCLTYESFGKQFMTSYCITCHTGAAAKHMVQLDTLAGVQKNKTAIKRVAVTNTVMPETNPKPTSAERQKLGQWLDCGPM